MVRAAPPFQRLYQVVVIGLSRRIKQQQALRKQRAIITLMSHSRLFDEAYYLECNPDVAQAGIPPIEHYIHFGASEGRNPGPNFDTSYYRGTNLDVVKAGLNPLAHFLQYGAIEGRRPHPEINSSDLSLDILIPLNFQTIRYRIVRHYIKQFSRVAYQQWRALLRGVPRSNDFDYQLWLLQHFPDRTSYRQRAQQLQALTYRPTISIILLVHHPSLNHLRRAVESVLRQIYPHWELCIVGEAFSAADISPALAQSIARDTRIKRVPRSENGQICQALNSALAIASGDFVALLEQDAQLPPHALYEVVSLLNQHPEADMIYSDEDQVNDQGDLREPCFKPDWCPDSFLSRMYTGHLGVYRKSLMEQIGGFRVGYEGAQDYDLVLRLTEQTQQIYHLPQVLYHAASTDDQFSPQDEAARAARTAITAALQRRGEPGRVEASPSHDWIVRYDLLQRDRVSIIIPTRNLGTLVDCCLTSIFEKSTYDNFEVLLIDNGSTEPATLKIIEAWKHTTPDKFRCIPYQVPFNYSQINNYAVQFATGEYLLFLNNDTEVITPDWLEALIEQGQRPSIGAVGAMLLYPNDTIQHAGVIAGIGGVAGHSHKCFAATASGYHNQIQTVNNYSAVTAACLLCRRSVFEEVNGFDEALAVAFNDVDLCFKILNRGYRNIYLPHVKLYHYESLSRGYDFTPEKQARFSQELSRMQQRWPDLIAYDPCYSPHLSRKAENYSLNLD